MTDKKERITVQIGDTKYILPEHAGQEEARVFEKELREAIRDGDEYTLPPEIGAVFNVGRPKTNDKERIMVMEAEVKDMRSKIEDLNKKLSEPKPAPTPDPTPAAASEPTEPPKE